MAGSLSGYGRHTTHEMKGRNHHRSSFKPSLMAERTQMGTLALLKRLWQFAKQYQRSLLYLLTTILLSAAISSVPPLLYRHAIDHVIPAANITMLNVIGGALLLLAVGDASLTVVKQRLGIRVGENIIFDIRKRYLENLYDQPLPFFVHSDTGSLVSRVTGELMTGHVTFTQSFTRILDQLATVLIPVIFMAFLDWRLTLLALFVAPIFMFSTNSVRGRLRSAKSEQLSSLSSFSSLLTERFNAQGALTMALHGRASLERDAHLVSARDLNKNGVDAGTMISLFHASFALVAAIAVAAIYWIGGRLVTQGSISLGTLVAFASYALRLYGPMEGLAVGREAVTNATVTLGRVFEVIDHKPASAYGVFAKESGDRPSNPRDVDSLVAEDITFLYPQAEEATTRALCQGREAVEANADILAPREAGVTLTGLSLTLRRGQMVGLRGSSGSGKTTLALVLSGVYEPSDGCVALNGIDFQRLDLEYIRKAVALVPQHPHFFHDTIRANLAYGMNDVSDRDMYDALELAKVEGVVHELPNGLDTPIGEGGFGLSGGQRQRLAIARMVLKDPGVVVLDESTSHLDAQLEVAVMQSLEPFLLQRVALVISHRKQNVLRLVMSYRMEGGTLAMDSSTERAEV